MKRQKLTRFIAGLLAALFISGTIGGVLPFHESRVVAARCVKTKRLNQTKVVICKEETKQLKMQGTSKKVTWKSSKKSVASVSASGKVTGKAAGTAVITAKTGGKKYNCIVIVKKCSLKDEVNKDETNKDETNKDETNKDETNKDETNKDETNKDETNKDETNKDEANKDETEQDSLKEETVYQKIIKMKEQYPEGMSWTNSDYYRWKGGIESNGYGCVAFAYILSDAAFGNLLARKHTNFNNIKVGDILRINNNTHSVIVLEVNANKVVVAEGNYNKSIHWGRTFDRTKLQKIGNYILTRYPNS